MGHTQEGSITQTDKKRERQEGLVVIVFIKFSGELTGIP